MTTHRPHIIRKQFLEVDLVGTEQEGFALQKSLPEIYHSRVTPVLEGILDHFGPLDDYLVIERLDIDAGTFTPQQLEESLAESIQETLAKALREEVPAVMTPDERGNPGKKNITLQSAPSRLVEALVHFLKNGRLPPGFSLPHDTSLQEELLVSWRKNRETRMAPPLESELLRLFKDPVSGRRLSLQFSKEFRESLLALLSPGSIEAVKEILALFESPENSKFSKSFSRHIWQIAFQEISAGITLTPQSFIEKVFHNEMIKESILEFPSEWREFLHNQTAGFKERLPANLLPEIDRPETHNDRDKPPVFEKSDKTEPKRPGAAEHEHRPGHHTDQTDHPAQKDKEIKNKEKGSTGPAPLTEKSHDPTNQKKKKSTHSDHHIDRKTPKHLFPKPTDRPEEKLKPEIQEEGFDEAQRDRPASGSEIESSGQDRPHKEERERPEIFDLGEGAYINNAGLVILHPFLPQFFRALHVARGDEIVDPDRALSLLYYLATGQSAAPEYELLLPKILCNISPDAPVDPEVELSTSEKAEAEALLEALIRHWDALKNTSPDGLRGTFLLRPGKVSTRADEWLLQVEPAGFDILLDHLPWGIGMIKLPWMRRLLQVEWR